MLPLAESTRDARRCWIDPAIIDLMMLCLRCYWRQKQWVIVDNFIQHKILVQRSLGNTVAVQIRDLL
jgi:hypothetical protein